jgi:hypothetical protein
MGLNLYSPTSSDAALPGASAANAVLSSAPVATSVVLLYAATKLSPPVSTTPKATIYASDSERILDEVDDLAAVGWRRRARVAVAVVVDAGVAPADAGVGRCRALLTSIDAR